MQVLDKNFFTGDSEPPRDTGIFEQLQQQCGQNPEKAGWLRQASLWTTNTSARGSSCKKGKIRYIVNLASISILKFVRTCPSSSGRVPPRPDVTLLERTCPSSSGRAPPRADVSVRATPLWKYLPDDDFRGKYSRHLCTVYHVRLPIVVFCVLFRSSAYIYVVSFTAV
jgi:hypothetical protein